MLKISVPATSANLGPGVDCIGVALDLHNHFYFLEADESAPAGSLLSQDSLCHRAFQRAAGAGRADSLRIAVEAGVPRSRGLGSSATLTVAGLAGANELCRLGLSADQILALAADIEGHPDNAAPALLGGIVLSLKTPGGIVHTQLQPAPDLQVVVAVPDFELATQKARKALPEKVLWADAVKNSSRFGLLVHAFSTGDYRHLSLAMEDFLHQPYRLSLVPGLAVVMEEANRAGALGSCLSGAGPSILALCREHSQQVARAMEEAWRRFAVRCRIYILAIDYEGIKIQKISGHYPVSSP